MQRISIHNKYQQTANALSNQIASEPDNFILGTSIDDLVNYYFSNNHFTPVEIDPEICFCSSMCEGSAQQQQRHRNAKRIFIKAKKLPLKKAASFLYKNLLLLIIGILSQARVLPYCIKRYRQ